MQTTFRGWSDAALDFYRTLELDNSRTFWTANRSTYDTEVRAPFDALADLVHDEFGELKVFRPNRDVRFSRDKSPYKTRCYGVVAGARGETFYVEISAGGLVTGTGFWMMANDQLGRYRVAVDDETAGGELERVVAGLKRKHLDIVGHALQTVPRGFPRDHPRRALLAHKSLAAMRSYDPAAWLHTKAAASRITDVWRAGAPLNDWLATNVGPTTEPAADPSRGRRRRT